jgi:hypothetical protein
MVRFETIGTVHVNESLVKYLAGLMDADGCLSFTFSKPSASSDVYYISLMLTVAASDTVDKHGFIESLPQLTGFGATYRNDAKNPQCKTWTVTKRSDLEMLLPRLIKHMFLKGKHWQWLLDARRAHRNAPVTQSERDTLVVAAKRSRVENVGPIKPKNHPTWAWVAGYLDGDGHFCCTTPNRSGFLNINVGATAHVNDEIVLRFIHEAFGGYIYAHAGAEHVKRWRRNLGPRDASFALRFLPKVARHSRFKRHRIDQILHIHQQRLSVPTPTGEAIV